jgi:ATP synthase protein I
MRRVLRPDDKPQAERRRSAQRQARAYQAAFESVFAILIGAGLGYLADARLGIAPWGVLTGLLLGFSAFIVRLVRLARTLQESAESERAENPEEHSER